MIPPERKEIEKQLRAYGFNSNSFMTLYPGFDYFDHGTEEEKCTIGHVKSPFAWVGGGDPLCPPHKTSEALRAFAQAGKNAGRPVLLLPVEEETARLAREEGYGSISIGCEPVFDLTTYDPTPEIVETARRLKHSDATVEPFDPKTISPELMTELKSILNEWLSSRKMAPLQFLNTVDPWIYSEHKRYFLVRHKGKLLAFLATIPAWPRKSWYLIDLIKRTNTPAGTTELLILEALRLLKNEGALQASLGVSPLSLLSKSDLSPEERGRHRVLYPILRGTFEYGNLFYHFKSLFIFKQKFKPSSYRRVHLIYYPSRLGPKALLGIGDVFMKGGGLTGIFSGFVRLALRFHPGEWLRRQVHPHILTRPAAPSRRLELARLRGTIPIILLLILFAKISLGPEGELKTHFLKRYVFTSYTIEYLHLDSLLFSGLLHWHWSHLWSNIALFIVFGSALESLGGTLLLLRCFILSALLSNLITWMILFEPARWLSHFYPIEYWNHFSTASDVGASLGIFGCIGGLAVFMKHRRWLTLITLSGVFVHFLFRRDFMTFNHWIAFALGWSYATWVLNGKGAPWQWKKLF